MQAARSFNHEYVGTEHILLGLIEERSAGVADVLATFEIDADKIRAEIEKIVTARRRAGHIANVAANAAG